MEKSVDEEGLSKHYDVILCGTGLVESILAAALARAGRKVLHVDGADYYGQLDAVWTLSYAMQMEKSGTEHELLPTTDQNVLPLYADGACHSLEILSMQPSSTESNLDHGSKFTSGTRVQTPYGDGIVVHDLQAVHDEKGESSVSYYTLAIELADGMSRLSVGISPSWVVNGQEVHAASLFQHHRIQTHTAATAAHLVQGPEARSVSLDITPLAVYAAGPAVYGMVASGVSEYLEFKSLEGLLYFDGGTLQPVPCSKKDVFASRLLSPMDKRRLMKFLQTALDFATAEALKEESQEDEDAETTGSSGLQTFNERHLNQGRSLSRPQNKAVAGSELEELQALCEEGSESLLNEYLCQRLSPSLAPLVHYALALANDQNTSTAMGVRELCAHMRALGRFGGTAFLVPMYGSGELSQAFCRSAAVFGATYLLRRAATGVVLDADGSVRGIQLASAQDDEEPSTKTIACDQVILSAGALQQSFPSEFYVVRRISLLSGKPLTGEQQRHVLIFPPGSFPGQTSVIHGIILDENSRVVPMLGPSHSSTLVHLTCTASNETTSEGVERVLSLALASLLTATVEEIFHMTFRYAVPETNTKITPGLHVIPRPRPGLTADFAFEEAERIFQAICPHEKFLHVAEKVENSIREALGDEALDREPDEEEQVLESAVGMLQTDAEGTS